MAALQDLRTCQGEDNKIHVRHHPTRKTHCRQSVPLYNLRFWPLEMWTHPETLDPEWHCPRCRARAIEELTRLAERAA